MRASQMNAQRNANTERALEESIQQVDLLKEKVERLERQVLEQQRRMEEQASHASQAMQTNIQDEIAKQLAQHLQSFGLAGGTGNHSLVVGSNTSATPEQSKATSVPRLEDQVVVGGDSLALCNRSTSFGIDLLPATSTRVLSTIVPSRLSETKRNKVIAFIREIVKKCLGCDAYLTGSYPTKTHLPDGDIDMTACICYSQEDTWYSILLDALCKSIQVGGGSTTPTTVGSGGEGGGGGGQKSGLVIRNATFVNAEVKVIKCVVDNINVDVSAKQFNALSTVRLIEEFDRAVDDPIARKIRRSRKDGKEEETSIEDHASKGARHGGVGTTKAATATAAATATTATTMMGAFNNLADNHHSSNKRKGTYQQKHLFKRSLLLLKAWLSYDAPVLVDREEENNRNTRGASSKTTGAEESILFGSDKGGLSTYALVIMLMMVFNCHQRLVQRTEEQEQEQGQEQEPTTGVERQPNEDLTPIHVLCIFLDTFAHWEWGLHSITTHGPYHIYKQKIVTKDRLVPLQRQPFDPSFFQMFRTLEKNDNSNGTRKEDPKKNTQEDRSTNAATTIPLTNQPVNAEHFRLGACNVVDPVNRTNNVGRALSRQRLQRLTRSLVLGQTRMKLMFQQQMDSSFTNGCIDESILSLIFPISLNKFGDGKGKVWRPDLLVHPRQSYRQSQLSASASASAPGPSSSLAPHHNALYRTMRRRGGRSGRGVMEQEQDLLLGDLQTFVKNVEYGEIVATVGWTSKSLKDIVVQLILRHSRGGVVLPVGEIGKGLLERTGNNSIMSEIKERYGGLKRFLESQNGITVGEDHPFNPSVTLDESLIPVGYVMNDKNGESGNDNNATSTPSRKKRGNRRKKTRKKQNQETRAREEREAIEEQERTSKLTGEQKEVDNGKEGNDTAATQIEPVVGKKTEVVVEQPTGSSSPLFRMGSDEFPALRG